MLNELTEIRDEKQKIFDKKRSTDEELKALNKQVAEKVQDNSASLYITYTHVCKAITGCKEQYYSTVLFHNNAYYMRQTVGAKTYTHCNNCVTLQDDEEQFAFAYCHVTALLAVILWPLLINTVLIYKIKVSCSIFHHPSDTQQ